MKTKARAFYSKRPKDLETDEKEGPTEERFLSRDGKSAKICINSAFFDQFLGKGLFSQSFMAEKLVRVIILYNFVTYE